MARIISTTQITLKVKTLLKRQLTAGKQKERQVKFTVTETAWMRGSHWGLQASQALQPTASGRLQGCGLH